jgi:hypothetical protein
MTRVPPVPISVEIQGVRELLGELKDFPEALERDVIRNMSQIAYDSMEKGAQRHFKTGALQSSLYNRAILDGREVGHDTGIAPHAQFVLFGTPPHDIAPKDKKALRWVKAGFTGPVDFSGKSGSGGFQFAGLVKHPGYIGDDYMEKAKDDAVALFSQFVDQALKDNL